MNRNEVDEIIFLACRYPRHTGWESYREWDYVKYPKGRGFSVGNFIRSEFSKHPRARYLLIREKDTGKVVRRNYRKCLMTGTV